MIFAVFDVLLTTCRR